MNYKRLIMISLLVVVPLRARPGPAPAQETPTMPLAERGTYGVGVESMTFVDDSRDDRELNILIYYPADAGRSSYLVPEYQAVPDMTGAPYPLILYSPGLGADAGATFLFGPHLASYGFVVASIDHQDPLYVIPQDWWSGIVYRPLDVLFALDELAALSEGTLAGMINTDNVGVAGHSYGGTTSLWVSGAQVDPDYMREWCAENEPDALPSNQSSSVCQNWAARWDEVMVYRSQFGPIEEDGLWPPLTDARIRAAMPMAPCFSPLLGENGTAADVLPTLVVFPGNEEVCIPSDSASFLYSHLGSPERYLLTLIGAGHDASDDRNIQAVLHQFGTAFFGYYLQGNADYAQYLTADYVGTLENVAWESSAE